MGVPARHAQTGLTLREIERARAEEDAPTEAPAQHRSQSESI